MSLPVGQQRILEQIEVRLKESDPRLSSLFVIFGRLTHGEAMPWLEAIRVRPIADRVLGLRMLMRRMTRRPAARVRALLLLPAALTAMICATVLAIGLSGGHRSNQGSKAPARELVVRPRMCRMSLIRVALPAC